MCEFLIIAVIVYLVLAGRIYVGPNKEKYDKANLALLIKRREDR
jgi:hypothetical protein